MKVEKLKMQTSKARRHTGECPCPLRLDVAGFVNVDLLEGCKVCE